MERRKFLITTGAVSTTTMAGCADILGGDSEEYEEGNEEDLVPDVPGDDWPDEDIEANHDINEQFLRGFATPDESVVVLMHVTIEPTVSEAEDSFESSKATAANDEEYPLADEALINDDGEVASCIFRKSNAKGQTLAARQSGLEVQPDRQRATEYAEIMYEDYW